MITANFSGLPSGEVLRLSDKLWQYDTGQQLKIQGLSGINENTEVHFALKYTNRAIVKTGEFNSGDSTLTADIPNLFLAYADGVPAKVWVHLRDSETSAHTIREIQIPVEPREKPDGYISPEDPSDRSFVETIVDEHITAYDAVLKDYVDEELDALDEAKADKTEVATVAERVMSLIPAIAGKANKSDTYTIQGTDTAIANAVAGLVSENSLPLMSVKRTSTDLNSEQINSICTVLGTTANRPNGVVGICLTLGTTRAGGIIAQLVLSATPKIYLRYKAGNNSSYTDWTEISSVQGTDTAIANAVTGLVSENSLPLVSTLKTSTNLNSEQINSICTVLGTTANRPDGVSGICLTLGTTRGGGVIAQLILSTTSKIYLRYKAGNGAVYGAWKECASAQELAQLRDESAQELEQFREELVNEGTNLLYLPDGTFEQSGTGNVKAVIKDQVITLSGNATGTAKYINIPVSVEMGSGTYTLKRFLDYADFSIMLAENTTSPGVVNVSKGSTDSNTVTLAAAAAPKYIRIYIPASVPEGTSLSSVFRLELKRSSTVPNAWESPVLLKEFLMPGLPLMSTFKISTDLDSEQINRLATVTRNTLNRPSGVFGICLTLGVSSSSNVRAQLILSTASKIYLRYNSGSGYGEWSEIGAGQDSRPEIKVPPAIDAFGIFDTVGFIGDSLGSGYADANGAITQYNDPPSGMNDYDVSWVQFMCRKTGRTGYQFSTGGQTTKGWLSTSAGNPTGINMLTDGHHKCQAYIIGLGVNDARQNAVPLGTSADIGGDNNNSFYRNYAKIISTIQETAPKAPIFCITIPKANSTNGSYDNVESYSLAIEEVAALYNSVYVIQPSISKVSELFALYKDIYHYSALGYARIAEYMLELLNACVEENKGDFVQLNLLESDPKEFYTKAEVDALIESLRNELSNS